MDRIVVSKNFYLDEFVDPETYFTEADHGLSKVHPEMIAVAQFMREKSGKSCNINTWWKYYIKHKDDKSIPDIIDEILKNKSLAKWSGYRSPKCKVGAKFSAHRKEGGVDLKISGLSGKEMFALAEKHAKELYALGLRRLEDATITPTWLHCDRRPHATPNAIRVVDRAKFVRNIKWAA